MKDAETGMVIRHSPSKGEGSPDVWGIYEADSGSIQYVCACPKTRRAALIDIVLNFAPANARTSTESAEEVLDLVRREGLKVEWILDTHPHADHLMAASWLKARLGVPMAIGEKVREIAGLWRRLYNLSEAFHPDRDFDRLFADGDTFSIGELDVRVMLSPGHTLGSITYVVGHDAAFVHDTLMYPDAGSSRADFPGGTAGELWNSIQEILSLPGDTRLFVGHDYCKGGREPKWEATVDEHLRDNVHVRRGTDRADFIRAREERDSTLSLPDRMLHALQVNLRGGRLPPPENDGNSYFKIPANRF
jgi:glyoxylase-like metal-dependent hydrolase (beta-lactamase superfamily II)